MNEYYICKVDLLETEKNGQDLSEANKVKFVMIRIVER